jgi:transposase
MTSRGKKKTTMAKLNREARLRERRVEKQARKDRRHDAAAAEPDPDSPPTEDDGAPPYAPDPIRASGPGATVN